MDDSEISILDLIRFDFMKKISISNYEQFLPPIKNACTSRTLDR